jgi:hypothetical protein
MKSASAGSRFSIFVAGIQYRSISEAALTTGLEYRGLYKRIEGGGGAPMLVRKQIVVSELWVKKRIGVVA